MLSICTCIFVDHLTLLITRHAVKPADGFDRMPTTAHLLSASFRQGTVSCEDSSALMWVALEGWVRRGGTEELPQRDQ